MGPTPQERARQAAALAAAKRERAQAQADSQQMRTGGRPKNQIAAGIRGSGPNGQWHDAKIRSVLRAHGYHVTASGGYNARVHSAWQDYLTHSDHGRITGTGARAGVVGWNKANVLPGGKAASPARVAAAQAAASGAAAVRESGGRVPVAVTAKQYKASKTAPAPKGKVGGGPKGNGGPKNNQVGLNTGGTNVGSLIPTSEAGNNPATLASQAAAEAGTQYDPQIYQLQTQIAQNPKQAAQDQTDIGHWYDQVIASEKAAGASDKQAADAASSAAEAATKAIMSRLKELAVRHRRPICRRCRTTRLAGCSRSSSTTTR